MHRNRVLGLALSAVAIAGDASLAQTPGSASSCTPARTALVLGGGGAKGFAHVGVFLALDSAGIRPDLIVGTSIGAITGALYASGYSGRQIDSITRVLPIGGVIHGYEPRLPGVLSSLPAIAVLERRGDKMQLQTGAVAESEVNALMSAMMVRGNLEAAGDFDRLPIPFRAVATEITTREPIVLSKGDLARAVRASFALPVIFEPVGIDGRVLNDGGMASNIPIEIARALGAERVIVSTLPSAAVQPSELDSPVAVILGLVDALVRNEIGPLGPNDVLIRNPTDSANLLDFGPAASAELVKKGYATAQAALAGAACVRSLSNGVRTPSPSTITVGHVTVNATGTVRPELVTRALGVSEGRRVSIDSLRDRLLAIGETGRYQALWLYPSPDSTASPPRVSLATVPIAAPPFSLGIGAAFDGDVGGRAWIGAALPALFGGRLDGGAEVALGRYRQNGAIIVRPAPGELSRGLTFPLELRGAHENVRRFVPNGELAASGTADASAFFGIAGAFHSLRWALGPIGTMWYTDSLSEWRTSGGGRVRMSTPRSAATRLNFASELTGAYWLASADLAKTWTVARLALQPFVRGGWGDDLPLQYSFPLGGADGFPGLRIGEWRGERMGMAGLSTRWSMLGPVALELELASGAVGESRGVGQLRSADADTRRVIWGGRLGLRIETPAGAIRVAEGVNSLGRHALFLRLGRWY